MGKWGKTVAALVAVGAVLAGQLVGVASSTAATGSLSSWSPLVPASRSDAPMVYDPAAGQLVLFGGIDTNGDSLGDTWTGNGTTWTEAAPASSPSARSDDAAAYDPATGDVVLFGGLGASNTTLSDTWTYNGTTWTAVTPIQSPPARAYASMAFDPALGAHGELVLFGGLSSTGTALSDTWAFDGTNWTALSPAQSPPARSESAMAYDAATGDVVLFGGLSGTTALSDTWIFNGTNWTQASPPASPPARSDAAMSYDAATSQLVLFSGSSGPGKMLSDTWTYNGTTWTQVATATSPIPRSDASFAYDASTSELVLFGGLDVSGNTLGDAWLSNGATWVSAAPPARSDDAMADDPALGQEILFGGLASNSTTALADTWAYNGTNWVQKVPTNSPPARSFASMAYDQASGQLVLFGGLARTTRPRWVTPGSTPARPGHSSLRRSPRVRARTRRSATTPLSASWSCSGVSTPIRTRSAIPGPSTGPPGHRWDLRLAATTPPPTTPRPTSW